MKNRMTPDNQKLIAEARRKLALKKELQSKQPRPNLLSDDLKKFYLRRKNK